MKTGKRTDDLTTTESQLEHLEYIYDYETGYWLDFVTSLIKANKINYHEWADSMPWAKHKAAEMLIERLMDRLDELTQRAEPTAETSSILDELRKKTAK